MLPIIFSLQSLFMNGEQPTKWIFQARTTSATEATVYFTVSIGRGWHLYAQSLPEGGPIKTTFTFLPSESIELIGKVLEPEPKTKYDKYFDMNVGYFESAVIFQQDIKFNDEDAVVKGRFNGYCPFIVCTQRNAAHPSNNLDV